MLQGPVDKIDAMKTQNGTINLQWTDKNGGESEHTQIRLNWRPKNLYKYVSKETTQENYGARRTCLGGRCSQIRSNFSMSLSRAAFCTVMSCHTWSMSRSSITPVISSLCHSTWSSSHWNITSVVVLQMLQLQQQGCHDTLDTAFTDIPCDTSDTTQDHRCAGTSVITELRKRYQLPHAFLNTLQQNEQICRDT